MSRIRYLILSLTLCALGVSLGVFGFLLDVIIWVVVVGGPFMLLGWGLKKLFLRLRR